MIVPSGGVLVPTELCAALATLAARDLRRHPQAHPDLLRIVEELVTAGQQMPAPMPDGYPAIDEDQYELVECVAERLGVGPETVRRYAREGRLPAVRGRRNQWLIERGAEPE